MENGLKMEPGTAKAVAPWTSEQILIELQSNNAKAQDLVSRLQGVANKFGLGVFGQEGPIGPPETKSMYPFMVHIQESVADHKDQLEKLKALVEAFESFI